MSKSRTSDLPAALWQLAQVIWVGGLWGIQVLLVPALERTGLADLLVRDILLATNAWVAVLAVFGIGLQLAILGRRMGLRAWLLDRRGHLLWVGMAAALAYTWLSNAGLPPSRLDALPLLVLGVSGLLLVLWPAPVRREP
ncbi:MFS transporter [Pseudomonas sp. KNUC1026]|uniref:MFS transporter n=1 Tax=Pseudomonas sp. KNUC1026 TaxID=2893890 RepID=UPI001F3D79AF|nr:MFS transporter [Pseudomonas sp. KNUC1026]UFH49974.1 MFS transporter [Pseudomonas sp. KNUC1026]